MTDAARARTFGYWYNQLISATGALGTGLLLLVSVLVCLLTISRYVLRINIPGLFEMTSINLLIFPFVTAAYTLRQGQHISVDVLTSLLSPRTRAILNIAVYSVASIYVVVLGLHSLRWAVDLFSHQVLMEASLPIQKGILVSIMAGGSILLFFEVARFLVKTVRNLPPRTDATGLVDKSWVCASLFLASVVLGVILLVYVGPAVGIVVLALVVLFSGMPVFLALGLVGTLGIYFFLGSPSLMQTPMTAYKSLFSFPLASLPLFILGGLIMERSGIVEDIFRFFEVWLGRSAISPLVVTTAVGLVFCAISGSSTAVTAILAGVAMPVLIKRGYSRSLCCGLMGGATVGTLIPPSIGYVVYAVLTEESIGRLFIAGLIPGLLLFVFIFLYIITLGLVSKKSLFENRTIPPDPPVTRTTWTERWTSLRTAVWGLLTPIIILGGIYAGIYTPTEAAGVLVVYAVVLSVFVKGMSWRAMLNSSLNGAVISSMILCIMLSAFIFALFISQTRMAAAFVAYARTTGMSADLVLLIIFLVLIILGCFLDAASMKVVTLPIFYPLAASVGIDRLWLGVFYQFLMEIGLLTPPVGLDLFVIKAVTKVPLSTVIKGNLPFVLMMILTVVLIYLFPQLVSWLPATMK